MLGATNTRSVGHESPPPPRCPACAYDLSGTPIDVCPECGGVFDREAVMQARFEGPRDVPWPANGLLVAALFVSSMEFRFGRADWWAQPVVVGAAWSLAAVWVWARRHAIRGDKPWLILWLNLLLASVMRVDHSAAVQAAGPWVQLAVLVGMVAWVGWRSPRWLARALLWVAAVSAWTVGGMYVVVASILITGGFSGEWDVLAWSIPSGGWNDVLVLGFGGALISAGFAARWGALRTLRGTSVGWSALMGWEERAKLHHVGVSAMRNWRRRIAGRGWGGGVIGALGVGVAVLMGACRSEPTSVHRESHEMGAGSSVEVGEPSCGERLSIELVDGASAAGVRPVVHFLELVLPSRMGDPGQVGDVLWAVPESRPGIGFTRSGAARAIWDGDGLTIDVGHNVPDLGLRLVLTPAAGGGWEGTWQRITIAGPVNGGPVRVRDAASVR